MNIRKMAKKMFDSSWGWSQRSLHMKEDLLWHHKCFSAHLVQEREHAQAEPI